LGKFDCEVDILNRHFKGAQLSVIPLENCVEVEVVQRLSSNVTLMVKLRYDVTNKLRIYKIFESTSLEIAPLLETFKETQKYDDKHYYVKTLKHEIEKINDEIKRICK